MQFEQIITGASGFVGGHLCRRLEESSATADYATLDLLPIEPARAQAKHREADLRSADMLAALSPQWGAPVLIHLAAMAEAVLPFARLSDLGSTNIHGTIHALQQFSPQRIVFASSSAVYGSVHGRAVRPLPGETAAIGAYGVSKLMGEVICNEWAEERAANAVALRFGNIVGPGCRGLIPFLVTHAARHPAGDVTAQLRGEGRLIRDYVDVGTAVECILAAARLPLKTGGSAIFNVGSGRGMSNREVAELVAEVLDAQGYRLTMNFANPVPAGESESVVLDVSETAMRLEVPPPGAGVVRDSIEQATLAHLERIQQQTAGP